MSTLHERLNVKEDERERERKKKTRNVIGKDKRKERKRQTEVELLGFLNRTVKRGGRRRDGDALVSRCDTG